MVSKKEQVYLAPTTKEHSTNINQVVIPQLSTNFKSKMLRYYFVNLLIN